VIRTAERTCRRQTFPGIAVPYVRHRALEKLDEMLSVDVLTTGR
jgi:hypothetical protein